MRRTHVPKVLSVLQTDEMAALYGLREYQNTLQEINSRLHLEHCGLRKPSNDLIDLREFAKEINNDADELRKLVSDSAEGVKEGQTIVFNAVIKEILAETTLDNPYVPIVRQPIEKLLFR